MDELLPLFSQTKINECYADITYPTLYGLDNLLTPIQEREVPPWEQRNGTLFFRGTTTGASLFGHSAATLNTVHATAAETHLECAGGHYRPEKDFTRAHRQRLVALAAREPHMDIGFSGFLQCPAEICDKMKALYGQLSPSTDKSSLQINLQSQGSQAREAVMLN